ncbi:MAG: pitrilysin family protein [Myxococcales bacterium]
MMNKRFFTTLGVTLSLCAAQPAASGSVSQAQAEEPKPVQPAVPPPQPRTAPATPKAPEPPVAQPAAPAAPPAAQPATVAAAPAAPTVPPSTLASLPIIRHTLENGLRVVLSPDRTIPTVGIAVYYDVGSRNEVRGRSGFAHLFEHMMFQGSANVGKGEHFQLILNRGGEMNGTTSEDRTNYYETLPSNELELGLWLEADRMKSLAITQDNFENQRQTVMEERRQSYDNQPYAKSWLRINELAYQDYWPYAHSTIGDMKDLENAPLSAVQEFFNAYYAPNNAVLTLVGDFDPDEALALVKKHFGNIPARGRPAYEPGPLNPQTEERSEAMVDDLAQLPGFHIAYHIPPARDPDHYALDILAMALGDGESSRLYQELIKRRELLSSLNVGTDSRRGPDLFSFWAVVAEGKDPKLARQVIFSEFEKVAKSGLSPRELEKAKNRMRSMFVFGLASSLERALVLGQYELYFGNAEILRTELDRYLAVTNEDIKRVASRYFAPQSRTVLDVVTNQPEKTQGAAK